MIAGGALATMAFYHPVLFAVFVGVMAVGVGFALLSPRPDGVAGAARTMR